MLTFRGPGLVGARQRQQAAMNPAILVTLAIFSIARETSARNFSKNALQYSEQFGGPGGTEFSDCSAGLHDEGRITSILISFGSWVDGIQVSYGSVKGPHHGGFGASVQTITLDSGEYIVAIDGRRGWYVDAFTFHTNKGRVLGPFGGGGGHDYKVTAPTGYGLRCIAGKSDRYLNSITYGWGRIKKPKHD